MGDDNGGATIKAYVSASVKSTDRIITLRGRIHSENGNSVIYAGSGVSPFFDVQDSFTGGVSVANIGTTAHTATLSDSPQNTQISRMNSMSLIDPTASDGSWVYLTGQVVTYAGSYYSYGLPEPGWISVYNIQGLDRTPGMRVYSPSNIPLVGSIVDVMAQLDTRDGQRILGIYGQNDSVKLNLLASPPDNNGVPVNVTALGMNNRDLCGSTIGNNPGVTRGYGLYNVGSYVTIWGEVLEYGSYPFDSDNSRYYMVIEDGSSISGDDRTATVFWDNQYFNPGPIKARDNTPGDYISISGVSSIWKPNGSTNTYRALWTSYLPMNYTTGSPSDPPVVTETGTISGTVKLYDMQPGETARVQVFSTCGRSQTLNVSCGANNCGSASFSWSGIPMTVGIYNGHPKYIVSAKCDGYKTRTYTNVTPWTGTEMPQNIYLTKLRKISVAASKTSIDACPGPNNSAEITAIVVGPDNSPVSGATVRFRTNMGSFSNTSIVHEYTAPDLTNSSGQVAITLYGVPSQWGDAKVEATDDGAPIIHNPAMPGDDTPGDDPYNYDWEQVNLTINEPSLVIELTPNPANIDVCGNIQSTITAHVTGCGGTGLDNFNVAFTTNLGAFSDDSMEKTVTTKDGGYASVILKSSGTLGEATVTACLLASTTSASTSVKITTDNLTFTASPVVGEIGQPVTVTVNVKDAAGNNISGRTVNFSQIGGNLPELGSAATNNSGNAEWTVSRSNTGKVTVTAHEDMSCSTVTKTFDVFYFDATPDDWTMFMHDPQHTGMSKTWDISTNAMTREWVVNLPTAHSIRENAWLDHPRPGATSIIFPHPYIDSSPVVKNSKVIVGTWDSGDYFSINYGSLRAFDANDNGRQVWAKTGDPIMGGITSTPCISDNYVFVGSANGYLYCFDLDGNQQWSRKTLDRSSPQVTSHIISSPMVHNGVVYITNEASKVYAFSADGVGRRIWSDEPGQPHDYTALVLPIDIHGIGVEKQNICGASSPAIATVNGTNYLIVGCDDGYLYRIRLGGTPDSEAVSLYLRACVESSPSISENNAYVGTSTGAGDSVHRIQIEPFAEIATWALVLESRATVSLEYNYAYNGVDTGHQFFKLDANDIGYYNAPAYFFGELYTESYFVGSAAHTTGGVIYTGNDNGRFYVLDANDLHSLVDQLDGHGYYDTSIQEQDFICSSPAIGYNVDTNHNRWIFITTRSDGGKLYAFKSIRN